MGTDGFMPGEELDAVSRVPSASRGHERLLEDPRALYVRGSHWRSRKGAYDLSRHGCKLEFVDRPSLDDRIWVKFEGLEALEALVCRIDGFVADVEFERPIHDAVFNMQLARLRLILPSSAGFDIVRIASDDLEAINEDRGGASVAQCRV